MKKLWTEAYRPKTLSDYVFRDEAQQKQVAAWVAEGSLPHLLFSGSAGVGKCLAYCEEIVIQLDTSSLTDAQLSHLDRFRIR